MMKQHIVIEILKAIPGTLNVVDTNYNIIMVGGEIARTFENTDQIIGEKCHAIFQQRDNPCPWCKVDTVIKTGDVVDETTTPDDPREKLVGKALNINVRPLKDKDGNIIGAIELGTDINHIREANEKRRRTEEALRQREAALEIRSNELEEVNSALRVLLKQRNEYKTELEEKMMLNVKELILPYIEKLKRRRLGAKSKAYLSVLESNLNDIISSFAHELSSKHLGLTPSEIQIAHLIRDGRTTKEMAELLNVSGRTIESHRQKIRMKLGLHGKKANLRSHLLSM